MGRWWRRVWIAAGDVLGLETHFCTLCRARVSGPPRYPLADSELVFLDAICHKCHKHEMEKLDL